MEKTWQYKTVDQIEVGTEALVLKNGILVPEKITSIKLITQRDKFYSLDVEPTDLYFANNILVHNSGSSSKSAYHIHNPVGNRNTAAGNGLADCFPPDPGKPPNPPSLDGDGCPIEPGCCAAVKSICEGANGILHTRGNVNNAAKCGPDGDGNTSGRPPAPGGFKDAYDFLQTLAKELGCDDTDPPEDDCCKGMKPKPNEPPCCLHESTKILLADGSIKNISKLKKGDELVSYSVDGLEDESNPLWSLQTSPDYKGQKVLSKIKKIKHSFYNECYEFKTESFSIFVTHEHPILVYSAGYPVLIK